MFLFFHKRSALHALSLGQILKRRTVGHIFVDGNDVITELIRVSSKAHGFRVVLVLPAGHTALRSQAEIKEKEKRRERNGCISKELFTNVSRANTSHAVEE